MKRINALARELKDHGIVSDFNEAYIQAEKMIEGGLLDRKIDDSSNINTTNNVQQQPQNNIGSAKPTFSNTLGVGIDALEIRNMNERIKNIETQLGQVFMKINEIIAQINILEKRKKESPIEVKQPEQRDFQAQLKSEKVQPHPRTGDFKPEDVSIEKMFYFGGGGR